MEPRTAKAKILEIVQSLPDDASLQEAMERLWFHYKVNNGLEQADSGQKVPHEEARQRLQKWLE